MTSQLEGILSQIRRRIQFDCPSSEIGGFREPFEPFGDAKCPCIGGGGVTRERVDLYGPAHSLECLVEPALH